jgi:hypothetical protein
MQGFLIASSENDIDLIYGYDDLVFCSSGSSVYLCRISEGALKEIYNNADMISFYPVTNHIVIRVIDPICYSEGPDAQFHRRAVFAHGHWQSLPPDSFCR